MEKLSRCLQTMTLQQEMYYSWIICTIKNIIDIVLSRQRNTTILQQIKFMGKLEENNDATIIFISEKQRKMIRNYSLDSLNITE